MNARQKAAQIYNQYWSDVNRKPISKQDPLPDIRPLIEKALIEAEEAKAREEREGCANIARLAKEESERIISTTDEENAYRSGAIYIVGHIERHIRARSESEKKL